MQSAIPSASLPENPGGIWSAINIKKVEQLTSAGLMKPAGMAAFELRKEHKSAIYSYEKEVVALSPEFLKLFKANKKAWQWFEAMPKGYQKICTNWVMSAKQEVTREKRMHELINDSAAV